MNLSNSLKKVINKSFIKSNLKDHPVLLMATKNPRFGDYQINGIMSAAKSLNVPVKDLALKVIDNIDDNLIIKSVEFSSPGFINLNISNSFLEKSVDYIANKKKMAVEQSLKNELIIIDYSSPNLAKQMHVGHLRSTIIGDSINRIAQFLGANVIVQNHVGDWGTQFGMLVAYLKEEQKNNKNLDLSDLEDFYRKAKIKFENNKRFADLSRECVIKLQNNDKDILKIWDEFVKISLSHIQNVYNELGVLLSLKDVKGESFYNSQLQGIVDTLLEKKVAINNNDGTKVVYIEDIKDKQGNDFAYIIQKKDGGFLYSTTDLACIKDNIDKFNPSRILYVVDKRQELHFKALFLIAKKASWLNDNIKLKHIDFGTMMSTDGKPFKTRDGGTIKLLSLLEESKNKAQALIKQKNPSLNSQELTKISQVVGIGSIKYSDLVKNRSSDYIFNWDNILSFEGNTASYLQYAYTRIFNLLSKNSNMDDFLKYNFRIENNLQKKLALLVLQFDETLNNTWENYSPHYLANYLYNLATTFNVFYERCSILQLEDKLKKYSCLKLVFIIGEVLKIGLNLLGIEVLEKM